MRELTRLETLHTGLKGADEVRLPAGVPVPDGEAETALPVTVGQRRQAHLLLRPARLQRVFDYL